MLFETPCVTVSVADTAAHLAELRYSIFKLYKNNIFILIYFPSGDEVWVEEAKDRGIISQIIHPDHLLQHALKVAETLSSLPQVKYY